MIDSERQMVLFDLLSHVSNGNFSVFDKLARKAWDLNTQNYQSRILVHNQMQACQMSGLIEIIETESSVRWSTNYSDLGVIRSSFPKKIYRGNELVADLVPLVVDEQLNALIVGNKMELNATKYSGFSFEPDIFFKFFPELNKIVNDMSSEEVWPRDQGLLVDVFDIGTFNWTERVFEDLTDPALIRIKGEFSGRTYLIIFPDVSLAFRISEPEWIFLASAKILKWSPDVILKNSEKSLKIHSRFRLPGIIKRFLFANSSLVKCGVELEFQNLCSKSNLEFLSFFKGKEYL